MCDEEVGAACQESWVGVFIQVLGDQLECRELLGGKGQLQSFGKVTSLGKKLKKINNECLLLQ